MNPLINLVVHKNKQIFDTVVVTPLCAFKDDQKLRQWKVERQLHQHVTNENNLNKDKRKINLVSLNERGYSSYLVSAYIVTLINSQTYRSAAYQKLSLFLTYKYPHEPNDQVICIKLLTPRKQFLDYIWNEKLMQMVLERREVDHAMSWLSTLGGAFSALGEEFQHCAEIAGKISVKQFQLALRLGDPLLVARCKLYAALSFIQRGQLKIAKQMIRDIYKFGIAQKDTRLQNMCQGVWAKLVYCYKLRKQRNSRMLS